ncbi:MAG: hypothetical protein MJK04_05735, partial [Psychrosphaera sp.]|nr:hypothetical protein [Psychrosphaera sp.]
IMVFIRRVGLIRRIVSERTFGNLSVHRTYKRAKDKSIHHGGTESRRKSQERKAKNVGKNRRENELFPICCYFVVLLVFFLRVSVVRSFDLRAYCLHTHLLTNAVKTR